MKKMFVGMLYPREKVKKLLLMTKFCLFFVVLSLNLHAHVYSQQERISVKFDHISAHNLFVEIEKMTDYTFVYEYTDVSGLNDLEINFSNEKVSKILDHCLKGTNLTYQLISNHIVIRKAKDKDDDKRKEIKGKVVDKKGNPLPGVTLIIKGTQIGTSTNVNGEFVLSANVGETIVVSFIGMKNQEINLKNLKDLKIVLEEESENLEEVIVNGYFNKSKESFTGSAVVVKSDELEKVASQNIISALQVFDPSFRIQENIDMGSDPNALPDFRIRGNSGFGVEGVINEDNLRGNPNLPTFILDGYEVSVEKIYDLDIARVKDITILKDASATAIYGSRAANGVVVINTKTPEPGKLRVNYNSTVTFTLPDLSDYNLCNAREKLEVEKLSGKYESDYLDSQQNHLKDYMVRYKNVVRGVDTYWLSKPLEVALGQKHSVYVEGGEQNVRYGLDLTYNSNPGVMKGSSRDRYNIGFMLSYNLNNKILFKNYISINKVMSKVSPHGSFRQYSQANPYFAARDEYGNLSRNFKVFGIYSSDYVLRNPLYEASLNHKDESEYIEFTNNFNFDWFISDVFRFKTRISYREKINDRQTFVDPNSARYLGYDYSYGEGLFKKGEASSFNENSYTLDANTVLTFNKHIDSHYVTGAIGGNIIENKFENQSFRVEGFPDGNLDYITYAKQFMGLSPNGDEGESRLAGFFSNLNYTYNNLYFVDFSYRLDGSSQFGSEKRYAPFWSTGIGCNLHKHEFFKNDVVNYFKITANIGQTGKASFSPYQAQTSFRYIKGKWYGDGIGATLVALGNEDLEWEKTDMKDINLSFQLFKGILSVNTNYYMKNTTDLLADITLPLSNGFRTYKDNLGQMENKGFEVNARAFLCRKKDLIISVFGSMAHNKNVIKEISNGLKSYNDAIDKIQEDAKDIADGSKRVSLEEKNKQKKLASTPLVQFKEGQSTTAIYAVKSLGINPANGRELYVYRDGSLSYEWKASEKVVCGDTEPDFSGSFGTNIDYKNFNLNMNFLYKYGGQAYNQTLVNRVENANIHWNVDKRVLTERWKQPGDEAFFKSIRNRDFTEVSSRFVMDDNMLQMTNLSLSYKFDKELISKWGMQKLKLTFLANDVFRISSIKRERGLDYPFARTYNINIQVQF